MRELKGEGVGSLGGMELCILLIGIVLELCALIIINSIVNQRLSINKNILREKSAKQMYDIQTQRVKRKRTWKNLVLLLVLTV